jgi:hypothetical protein
MTTSSRIIHKYQDKFGIQQEQMAKAVQKDRAKAGKFESVEVPAGRFNAYCIRWRSRISIKVKGRPVLEALTTEPYRRETMWISPGIGIVKRIVAYLKNGRVTDHIVFELVSYRAADNR